jgi:hypothetical protein
MAIVAYQHWYGGTSTLKKKRKNKCLNIFDANSLLSM